MRKLEQSLWWPECVMLKDALSLRELGERYGVTPAAIAEAFCRCDITRTPSPPGPRGGRSKEVKAATEAALKQITPPTVKAISPPAEKAQEVTAETRTFSATIKLHAADIVTAAELAAALVASSPSWKVVKIAEG